MAKTAHINIAEAQTENYKARVIREKASFLEFLLRDASGRYVLEVLNKENGRLKREKIGYTGVAIIDNYSSLIYFNNIDSIVFKGKNLLVAIKKCYIKKESEGESSISYSENEVRSFVLGDF